MIIDSGQRDLSKYTECYDVITDIRMLRWSPEHVALRYGKAFRLLFRAQFLSHYWGYPPKWRLLARHLGGGPRVLPDFACVGSIKSGTSDLATNLFAHPSIVPPFSKEIFDDDVESWRAYYPTAQEMTAARDASGAARTGYFTPWLSHRPLASRFHAAVPDGKAILVLRDPVNRAYSHYKWEIMFGGPALLRKPHFATYSAFVDRALADYPKPAPTICGEPFLQCGLYADLVEPWLNELGRDNVLILAAEDYFRRPAETLDSVYEFLGLESIPYVRAPKLNENPVEAPAEDESARARLVDFYAPHNAKLYELIDRDLGWV